MGALGASLDTDRMVLPHARHCHWPAHVQGVLRPRRLAPLPALDECRRAENIGQASYDLIGQLFRQMNDANHARGGRFAGVDYFNGGLFSERWIDEGLAEEYASRVLKAEGGTATAPAESVTDSSRTTTTGWANRAATSAG